MYYYIFACRRSDYSKLISLRIVWDKKNLWVKTEQSSTNIFSYMHGGLWTNDIINIPKINY